MLGIAKSPTCTTCLVVFYPFVIEKVKVFTGSDIKMRSVKKQRELLKTAAVHLTVIKNSELKGSFVQNPKCKFVFHKLLFDLRVSTRICVSGFVPKLLRCNGKPGKKS